MDFLSSLNEQQREAVENTEGSLLILAGAGSGKTRVIAHRIAYLIAQKGVAPWNILAVTFTNKAAQEMRQRVQQLLRDQELSSWPLVSTFHSLCVRILRQDIERLNDKYTRTFTIYDQDDSLRLIKNCIKDLGYDEKHLGLRATQSAISSAKNRGEDVDAFAARADYVDERRAAQGVVYAMYEERLHANNALDFDDLLIKAVRLLRDVPEVREKCNNKFRYILVDEYQDTNSLQFALIGLLTEKQQNICVVGDEDQSIYKWRGADITNILNFEKHFPNTKTIRLEQNYRSTQTILDVAGAVVKHNIERKGKNLWTSNPQGDKVRYFQALDAESEARFVASKILEHRQDEFDLRAAVLYRTNSQSRVFEEAMRRAGLTYNIVGGFSFYERMEVRDIIAYLKLALNPNDSIALQRVINSPARGIGRQTLDELTRRASAGSASASAGSADILSADLIRTASGSDRVDRGSSPPVRTASGSDRIDRDSSPLVRTGGDSDRVDRGSTPLVRTGSGSDRVDRGREGATASSLSLWETISLVIEKPENLSTRAVSALKSFRRIILRLASLAGSVQSPMSNVQSQEVGGSPTVRGVSDVESDTPKALDNLAEGKRSARHPGNDVAYFETSPRSGRQTGPGTASFRSIDSDSPVSDIVKAAILDSGYENALEGEKTDEAEARLENLQELVNAAVDYDEQGIEGLREFIDHSALVSDADQYKQDAPVTLMTAHSAKGLEFPLVFIVGLEDGLFPHSRSATAPAELEEERRLCYVAMTRAEKFLYVTHAMKRRVYGEEFASEPSQFLNEMPLDLMEDLSRGNSWLSFARGSSAIDYEHGEYRKGQSESAKDNYGPDGYRKEKKKFEGKTYDSVDSIAEFFKQRTDQLGNTRGSSPLPVPRPASKARGSSSTLPVPPAPGGPADFVPGSYVRHSKYGRGLVLHREGVGESLKLTVTFPGYGQKKLIQKYAGLEKA